MRRVPNSRPRTRLRRGWRRSRQKLKPRSRAAAKEKRSPSRWLLPRSMPKMKRRARRQPRITSQVWSGGDSRSQRKATTAAQRGIRAKIMRALATRVRSMAAMNSTAERPQTAAKINSTRRSAGERSASPPGRLPSRRRSHSQMAARVAKAKMPRTKTTVISGVSIRRSSRVAGDSSRMPPMPKINPRT